MALPMTETSAAANKNPDYCFARQLKLTTGRQYSAVLNTRKTQIYTHDLTVRSKENGLGYARLGIIISKKNVRLAVARNRLKRLIREGFRLNRHKLWGLDIVILVKKGADSLERAALRAQVEGVWKRLMA
jgi:ribonuclease P protein component